MSATPSADIPQFEITSGPGPDDVYVVRVAGEVDMSHEDELRDELRAAVAADAKGIVVDLTECEFIDSSGVRTLLLSREEQRAGIADPRSSRSPRRAIRSSASSR